MTSSVNEFGVSTAPTSLEDSTATIMRMRESVLPVCSSMMAEIAIAMRVHPPRAAPAPSTAYTVG